MPRYARPRTRPLQKAAEIFGVNEARMAILAFIASTPDATRSEIASATGLNSLSVLTHLQSLVSLDALVTDPPDPQQGQWVRYRINRSLVSREARKILQTLSVGATGSN